MNIAFLDKNESNMYNDYLIRVTDENKKNPDVAYLGAFDEDELEAVLAYRMDSDSAELLSICVAGEVQMQNIGISLVEKMTDEAASKGAVKITAKLTEEDLENGIDRFLWRCGFEKAEDAFEILLKKEPEVKMEEAPEPEYVDDEEESTSAFARMPVFETLTNDSLVCGTCRYALDGPDVLECHRYEMKPIEILNDAPCSRYCRGWK